MPLITLLAVVLCLHQEPRTGSVEVLLDLAFEFQPECWRVEMELEMPDGRNGIGKRTPNEEGVARFDAAPVGRGTIALYWIQPGVARTGMRADLLMRSQPIGVTAGSVTRLDWRMASELALVSLTIHDPSGRADKDDYSILLTASEQDSHEGIGGEVYVPDFGHTFAVPALVGSGVTLVSTSGSALSFRTLEPTWRIPAPGRHVRDLSIPDGRIAVRLQGDPPHREADWSNCTVSLAADPRWRKEWLPFTTGADRQGVAVFDHVLPGDYFVELGWSEDGDDWFGEPLLRRWIRFEGGDRQIEFGASGVGAVALTLPPGAGQRVTLTRDSAVEQKHELEWPASGAQGLQVGDLPVGRWSAVAEGEGVRSHASFEVEAGLTTTAVFPRWHRITPVSLRLHESEEVELIVLHIFDASGTYWEGWDLAFEGRWDGRMMPGTARVTASGGGVGILVAEFEVPESLPEGVEVHVVELEFREQDQ